MKLAPTDIEAMTREDGEAWAYPHVQRLIKLSEMIAGDLAYQREWFWYAAHLHDWGAFPRYRQPGVDHALRSKEIAEHEILPHTGLPPEAVRAILEAIEFHDLRDTRPVHALEALLLREADFLDFLGPLGVARELAWGPNNLRKVIDRVHTRIENIRGRFTLPAAQAMGAARIAEMETLLLRLEQESFGYL